MSSGRCIRLRMGVAHGGIHRLPHQGLHHCQYLLQPRQYLLLRQLLMSRTDRAGQEVVWLHHLHARRRSMTCMLSEISRMSRWRMSRSRLSRFQTRICQARTYHGAAVHMPQQVRKSAHGRREMSPQRTLLGF